MIRWGLLTLLILFSSAAIAQAQDGEIYHEGLRVWAEDPVLKDPRTNMPMLHSKARVVGLRPDQVEVAFFEHNTLEDLASLKNFGPEVGRHWVDRNQLDWWNKTRYELFVEWNGALTPKARIVGKTNNGKFKVEVFNFDGDPAEIIEVSRADILKQNVPTYPKAGERFGGIEMDFNAPESRAVIADLNRIVDRYMPELEQARTAREKGNITRKLHDDLFIRYKEIGIEHPGNLISERVTENGITYEADSPTGSERQAILTREGRKLSGYIKSQCGTCGEQAAIFVALMSQSGTRAGIHYMQISGAHGEALTVFPDRQMYAVDLTASRNVPAPNRNFEALSTSQRKAAEIVWHRGDANPTLGLGYNRSLRVSAAPEGSPIPENYVFSNPDRFDAGIHDSQGGLQSRDVRSTAAKLGKAQVRGAGEFATAYLLKETMKGRFPGVFLDFANPEFLKGYAGFVGASSVTGTALSTLPVSGVAAAAVRTAIPLAAGMAAIHALSGSASMKNIAVSTLAYGVPGILGHMIAAHPMIASKVPLFPLRAGMLALTLLAGEALEKELHNEIDRDRIPVKGMAPILNVLNKEN